MTREHKLALIVGFSLVLLVGVLIADHLSLARRVQIAPVGDKELSVARGPTDLMDPLRTIEHQLASQTPAAPETQSPQVGGPVVPPLAPIALDTPPAGASPVPGPQTEPILIAQGRGDTSPVASPDDALITTARAMGWDARQEGGVTLLTQTETVREPGVVREPGRTLGTNAPPAPAAVKPVEAVKTYTVQKGDTYFRIAQKHYGDGNLWKLLAKFNGGDEVVRLGSAIRIPSVESLTGKPAPATDTRKVATRQAPQAPQAKPAPKKTEPAPAKPSRLEIAALTYTVKRGDTLGEISQRTLGTSRRWREIADLNRLKDVDLIPAGTVLKLPPMRG